MPYLDVYHYLVPKSYSEPFTYSYRDWFKDELYKCSTQMLRSVGDWSAGISETETSILNAYCDLIKKSEYYIYIEVWTFFFKLFYLNFILLQIFRYFFSWNIKEDKILALVVVKKANFKVNISQSFKSWSFQSFK